MKLKTGITLLIGVLSLFKGTGQTTNFSFTNKPFSDPEMNNWGRGAVYWNGVAWDEGQAPSVPAGTSRGKNSFWRFSWCDLEDNNGNYVFDGTWPRLDHYVRQTIDRGEMLHFGGVMPICSACGTGGNTTTVDGATMYFPKYIYDSMQKTSQPAWNTGTGLWMPNWNNPYYLERYEKLLLAIANYFNTRSYVAQSGPWAGKRIYYKDLLDGVGINGYGDFGEWHNWPYDDRIPANAVATSASLKRIIDANITAFPNTQLVTLMGSFYNGGSSKVPLDVTYYVFTARNNFGLIGWRRDNIGDPGYGGWLENNPNSFNGMRFDTAILNRWKYAIVTGEPLNGGGSCCPYYYDIRRQTNLYHYSAYGNGNYGSRTQQVWDTIRNVFKISGYRYNLNGGSMTSTLTAGQPFNVSLNWRNVGVAPIYQKRWKVKYELKNSSDQVIQSWVSRHKLYLFLPASADSIISETFTLNSNIAPASTYKLTLKLEDTVGVLEPIYLAVNSPTRNTDGSYTLRSNITVVSGALPVIFNSFNATKKGNAVQLAWNTNCDADNRWFEVERSKDGVSYDLLAIINAQYNCLTYNYAYSDYTFPSGIVYYRIKQLDIDGTITYSKTVAVNTVGGKTKTAMTAFPNPATSELNVVLDVPSLGETIISIHSADGKLIKQRTVQKTSEYYTTVLDIEDLNVGLYIVKIKIDNNYQGTTKFVKN